MNDVVTKQIDAQPPTATLRADEGRWTLTMSRDLRHPVERVWPMLTSPEGLARWSPFVPDREVSTLGPATARENPGDPAIDAEVLRVDPPRELVHRWGDDRVRWLLEPTPEGSRLTLMHTFAAREEASMYAAGWHICQAVLVAVLDGEPVARVVGPEAASYGWSALRDRYADVLG
jgi:uncharacterized protein YndB with AHSA1/START domain